MVRVALVPIGALVLLCSRGIAMAQAPGPSGHPAPRPAERSIAVKAQYLELTRSGSPSVVKRFRVVDSPVFVLNNLVPARARILTGGGEPLDLVGQIRVVRSGTLSLLLHDRSDPPKLVFQIDSGQKVKVGDTVVVSGRLTSKDGIETETFIQLSFSEQPNLDRKVTTQRRPPVSP